VKEEVSPYEITTCRRAVLVMSFVTAASSLVAPEEYPHSNSNYYEYGGGKF
jgi:hypothetical protein